MADAIENLDDTTFAVLNTVLLKKSTTVAAVAAATDVAPDAVAGIVERLADDGCLVVFDDQLLPDDRATDLVKQYNERHWGALRDRPELHRWHDRFEHVNELMLAAFNAWQLVRVGGEEIRNDHTDAAYDDKVMSRIDGIIAKVEQLLDQIARQVPRFARYGTRLNEAMDAAQRDRRFVSDPRVESVHNIWFEMHEDILLLLGKERVS